MRARTLLLALFVAPFVNGCVCEEDFRHERHERSARAHDDEGDPEARPRVRRRVVRGIPVQSVRRARTRDTDYQWFAKEVMRIQSGRRKQAPQRTRRQVRVKQGESVEALRKRMENARRRMEQDRRRKRKKDN